MKIARDNAERSLHLVLKKHWYDKTLYRCAVLGLSGLDDAVRSVLVDYVTREADACFGDASGMIFRCHDDDLFVVARFLTHKKIEQFIDGMIKTHPTIDERSRRFLQDKAAFLYEISVDWPKLKVICDKKIEKYIAFKAAQQKDRQAQEAKLNRHRILNVQIDAGLLSSLADRRRRRETPEVMIVEDDLFTQKLVGNAIEKRYHVSMAQDGYGALMMYAKKAPDILFLDIGLPDISGHEVLHRIFEIDPEAFVVMLSGNGDRDNVMKAVDRGARGFIGKPFTKDKLFQYIEKSPFIRQKTKQDVCHEDFVS